MAQPLRSSPWRGSDLRGLAQLATRATIGITDLTEGVHQSVWGTLGVRGPAPGRTGGLTGLIYHGVRGVMRGVGRGVEVALGAIEPLLGDPAQAEAGPPSARREAVLAALNGVMGDRLVEAASPFATPMTLRHRGQALDPQAPVLPGARGRVLLLIHGLCMNELQWRDGAGDAAHDHGEVLAAALAATPLALRYNSGLPISHNGALLARQLEQLVAHWPVPLTQLDVLAHSMGGLVIRSAVQSARDQDLQWPRRLGHLVFLGTPHHGAPLERAGHGVDLVLGGTPWSRPFARLGQLRSAGITDLRHGNVRDSDWAGRGRFVRGKDTREPLPLPEGVACHTVAATTAARRSALADRLVGDGLVPLRSALGEHDDPRFVLRFAPASRFIAWRTGHLALLRSPEVARQVLRWLAPAPV